MKMKDYKSEITIEDKKYMLYFNLNVMEQIQEEYKTVEKWGALTDGKAGEVNAKALIFGLTAMLNEGIEIENEETGTAKPLLTKKQVGRLITKLGVEKSAKEMNKAIIESTKSDEKNE